MSIKSKVLAAAATLTLVGGVGTVGVMSAGAATPSCGSHCIDVFSKQFGTFHHPAFALDVFRQGAKVGQPLILFRTSNTDPAQDFTISFQGKVSDFYAAGLVSSALDLHYGSGIGLVGVPPAGNGFPDDFAFEVEYAPYGVDSGLCAGLATTAIAGEKVTLQPCGVSAKTTWVADTVDSCPSNPLYFAEVPAINGSSTNFSHPHVLTYPGNGYPTDIPRPQLFVSNLTGFSQSGGPGQCGTGSVNGPDSNQLWAAVAGVLS
jgi:hypothetical protein